MIDRELEERVAELLEELGPADPPAGLLENVMARISLERRKQATGRIIPFNQGGIAMTRKAMWGIAAAAAVLLAVFAVRGFPPVGYGTEGTVGAAKKYQAPQIAAKDVVLGDAVAQEFLQSEAFDQLIKDPQARSLLSNPTLQVELKKAAFVDLIRDASARQVLTDRAVLKMFDSLEARTALEDELGARMAVDAVKNASADARGSAHAEARNILSNSIAAQMLSKDLVRQQLANDSFRQLMRTDAAAAAMRGDVLAKAMAHQGFKASVLSGKLETALAPR